MKKITTSQSFMSFNTSLRPQCHSLVFIISLFVCMNLTGAQQKRLLLLLDRGFNNTEFSQIYYPLKALGYKIDIASPEGSVVRINNEGKPSTKGKDVQADISLVEAFKQKELYAGLIIPGGYSPGHLEKIPVARDIATFFMNKNKPVAAVCHGPRLLITSG